MYPSIISGNKRQLVQMVLEKGANVNIKGAFGYTALHECSYLGYSAVSFFLEQAKILQIKTLLLLFCAILAFEIITNRTTTLLHLRLLLLMRSHYHMRSRYASCCSPTRPMWMRCQGTVPLRCLSLRAKGTWTSSDFYCRRTRTRMTAVNDGRRCSLRPAKATKTSWNCCCSSVLPRRR